MNEQPGIPNARAGRTSTARRLVCLLIAVVVFCLFVLLPPPQSLRQVLRTSVDAATGTANYAPQMHDGKAGMVSLAALCFALILWITEAAAFHITGLLVLVLLSVFKVGSYTSIIATGFGNDIVVFFIGVLVLSAFITRSGLGKRISVLVLSLTGNSTRRIILGFLVAGALVSMWITDMAVAAILMPLGRAILQDNGRRPLHSNFGKALMISCAWGPLIGGIATPAGCGANPIAMQFLQSMVGVRLSFLDWMAFGVPSALLLLIPSWLILLLVFPPEIERVGKSREELKEELKGLPPLNREEAITLLLFGTTIVLWVLTPLLERLLGMAIPISLPVLLTLVLFFMPGMSASAWKSIEQDIDWAGILLIVSGISLGTMLYKSGAAEWLAVMLLGWIGSVGLVAQLFVVALGVCVLKVVFSSNTVTATIIIPLIIGLGRGLGMNVVGIALAAGMTSSLAFILVTTTPTNVIPYTAGYFSIKDMAIAGSLLTVVSAAVIAVVFVAVGRLAGVF